MAYAETQLCEHCDALANIVSDLVGPKVSAVLMKRVKERMHASADLGAAKCDSVQPASP